MRATPASADASTRSMRMPAALVEVAGAVVPPRVAPRSASPYGAEDVDEAPALELGQRLALGRAHVRGADELGRVVHVAVVGGDVEVAAHDDRLVGRARRPPGGPGAGRATPACSGSARGRRPRPLGTYTDIDPDAAARGRQDAGVRVGPPPSAKSGHDVVQPDPRQDGHAVPLALAVVRRLVAEGLKASAGKACVGAASSPAGRPRRAGPRPATPRRAAGGPSAS